MALPSGHRRYPRPLLSGLRFVPRSELWYNDPGDTMRRWTDPEGPMKTLYEMAQEREARLKDLERNLQRVVLQLKDLGARKIVLFGSLARGDISAHSDLDLLAMWR